MKRYILLFAIASQCMLSSCSFFKKESSPQISQSDSIYLYTYELMNYVYYWLDDMEQVNWQNYTDEDPADLMGDMIYKKYDRWSNVYAKKDLEYFFTGESMTYGFTPIFDAENLCRVAIVYRQSPAFAAGMRRGSIIKKINNTEPIFISDWNFMSGENLNSITVTFSINGKDTIATIDKAEIVSDQILGYSIIPTSVGNTGYIAYESFTELSSDSVVDVMKYFKSSDVTDLIIDLRYNGGGDIEVLTNWANYLLPQSANNQALLKFSHNKYIATNFDSTVYAHPSAMSLGLNRVFVIVTENTASASESLINILEPYMDVQVIGTTTHGKPVGMYVFEYQDWYLLPISFLTVNKNGKGGYFDGISPDLTMIDQPSFEWGDPDDPSVAQALHFIENGNYKQSALAMAPLKSIVQQPVPFKQIGLLAKRK